jgi:hypothetical protein
LAEADSETLRQFLDISHWLADDSTCLLPFHAVEQRQRTQSRELQRLFLQRHLAARGNGYVGTALLANGVLFNHRRLRSRTIRTLAGEVHIQRLAYSHAGAASIHPLDEALQLPARSYSYDLQKHLVKAAVQGPFQESLDRVCDLVGFPIHKRSLEGMVLDSAQDFDAFYGQRPANTVDSKATLLVLSVDAKGIPLIRPAPVSRPIQPAKGPRPGTKKMATVATVFWRVPWIRTPQQVLDNMFRPAYPSLYAETPPRPLHKRVWASLRKSKADVIDEVCQEMLRRDPRSSLTRIALTDGERAFQRLVDKKLRVTLILDLIHVLDYVWDAAHVLCLEDPLQSQVCARLTCFRLLNGDVCQVIKGLRQSATKRCLVGPERDTLLKVANYFDHNQAHMRYDDYLARGFPIASGPVEGACKNLIGDRLDRSGMHWTELMAEAVVRLRAIYLSGDFDSYWPFHINQDQARLHPQGRWTPVDKK